MTNPPDTSVTERVAGHFFRARVSLPQAQTNAFWERSLEHHREMVAKYPEYAHARSLVHDCFRDAEIAIAAISSMPALEEALDRKAIRKLEDDVQAYSGNEASGYAEINRRKAAAWDRIAALTSTREGLSTEQEGK